MGELTELNVGGNELTSLEFVKSFPSLTQLTIAPGNSALGEQYHFLAVFYCKKLATINGNPTDKYKTAVKNLRKSLLQIVTEVGGERRVVC